IRMISCTRRISSPYSSLPSRKLTTCKSPPPPFPFVSIKDPVVLISSIAIPSSQILSLMRNHFCPVACWSFLLTESDGLAPLTTSSSHVVRPRLAVAAHFELPDEILQLLRQRRKVPASFCRLHRSFGALSGDLRDLLQVRANFRSRGGLLCRR